MSATLLARGLPRLNIARFGRPVAPISTVDQLRVRGVAIIAIIGWIALAVLLATEAWRADRSLGTLLTIGVLVNIAPTLVAVRGRFDSDARITVATLAAAMPALLVYALRGHPWQMDGHMYFFVALAMLTVLCDWRPIAVASTLIAVHHLLFETLAPQWVFTGSGNFSRVLIHALAVALQCGILGYVTSQLRQLLDRQDAAVREGKRLIDEAEAARTHADEALMAGRASAREAAAERARREDAERRAVIERDAELRVLASEFERTVSSVAKSIETASANLAGSSTRLSDLAGEAGREADDVAHCAAEATDEFEHVAESLHSLTMSIGTIAATSEQQSGSTRVAYAEGGRSVDIMSRLCDTTGRIGAIVDVIRTIATKTNMLALNATIEAARAGEAGRGFAVVAAAVKHLANDSKRASDEISSLLKQIHDVVDASAAGIETVTARVREVSEGADAIAAAVGDQRGYTGRIEESAARAASSAQSIEDQIVRVAAAVSAASQLSVEVHRSAGALSADAGALRTSTDRFVSFLRAEA